MIQAELSPESITALRRMAKEAGPTIARRVNKALRAGAEVGKEAARKSVLGPPPGHVSQPKRRQAPNYTKYNHLLDKETAAYNRSLQRKWARQHAGLRAGIARGTRVAFSAKSGVRIASTSSALPANQKGMNRVYREPSWRHPVMGNRKVWVEQLGKDWFYKPISERVVEIRAGLEVAVKVAAEEISKGV